MTKQEVIQMGACNLDHSLEDVRNKLEIQQSFLPALLFADVQRFLQDEQPQAVLNELFHLLKKYDLVSREEQEERNEGLQRLIKL
jgi:hypothetical protein